MLRLQFIVKYICMNKNRELDIFEKDDWLSKERQRESRISAWDFDDAKKLRNEHKDDCDVEAGARFHRLEHSIDANSNSNSIRQIDGDNRSRDILWFCLDIILLFVLSFVNILVDDFNIALIVLFLGINPGIFIWLFIFKRFPPERYSKLLFILAIILQIGGILIHYFAYY